MAGFGSTDKPYVENFTGRIAKIYWRKKKQNVDGTGQIIFNPFSLSVSGLMGASTIGGKIGPFLQARAFGYTGILNWTASFSATLSVDNATGTLTWGIIAGLTPKSNFLSFDYVAVLASQTVTIADGASINITASGSLMVSDGILSGAGVLPGDQSEFTFTAQQLAFGGHPVDPQKISIVEEVGAIFVGTQTGA